MRRGQVRWADLGLPCGSAPALRRPTLIVSADAFNRSALQTVTVVVLTTDTALAGLPGNVKVPAGTGGVETDSVVNVTQVAAVDRKTLEESIGALPDWLMAQVDAGLERALGLAPR